MPIFGHFRGKKSSSSVGVRSVRAESESRENNNFDSSGGVARSRAEKASERYLELLQNVLRGTGDWGSHGGTGTVGSYQNHINYNGSCISLKIS